MGNIRDLNALHQVMKGDITLDKAMAIGEVSHRKDGDYRKVAQGKWVPVPKAGDRKQPTAGSDLKPDIISVRKEIEPLVRHYQSNAEKIEQKIESVNNQKAAADLYGSINAFLKPINNSLESPDVLEEDKVPLRPIKERLEKAKKRLLEKGERSFYGNRQHSALEMLRENARQLNEALAEGKRRGAAIVEFTDSMGKVYKQYWNGARYEDKPSSMQEQYGGNTKFKGTFKETFKDDTTDSAHRLTSDTKIRLSKIKR